MVAGVLGSCMKVCVSFATFCLYSCPIDLQRGPSSGGAAPAPISLRHPLPPSPSHPLGEGKLLEEEPHWKDLARWVRERGDVSDKVAAGVLREPPGGTERRGLYALADIRAGEELARVPRECCLDGTEGVPDKVQALLGQELFSPEAGGTDQAWVSTAVRILLEERKGGNSSFFPMLRTLPAKEDLAFHPQMWPTDWLSKSDPRSLGGEGKIAQSPLVTMIRGQRRATLFLYPRARKAFGRLSLPIPSVDEWVRAAVLAMSRATLQKLDPVVDLVNHHPLLSEFLGRNRTCNAVRVLSPDDEALHLVALRNISKGDEILMDYSLNGTMKAFETLCSQGFLPADATTSPDPDDWGLGIRYRDLFHSMGGPRLFDWTLTWVMPAAAKYEMKLMFDDLLRGRGKHSPIQHDVCDVRQIWRLSRMLKEETRSAAERALLRVFLSVRVAMLAVAFKDIDEDLLVYLERSLHEYLQTLAQGADGDELVDFNPTFDAGESRNPAGLEVMGWLWPAMLRARTPPRAGGAGFEDDEGVRAAVEKYGGGEAWTVLRNRKAQAAGP